MREVIREYKIPFRLERGVYFYVKGYLLRLSEMVQRLDGYRRVKRALFILANLSSRQETQRRIMLLINLYFDSDMPEEKKAGLVNR